MSAEVTQVPCLQLSVKKLLWITDADKNQTLIFLVIIRFSSLCEQMGQHGKQRYIIINERNPKKLVGVLPQIKVKQMVHILLLMQTVVGGGGVTTDTQLNLSSH